MATKQISRLIIHASCFVGIISQSYNKAFLCFPNNKLDKENINFTHK